MGNFLSAKYWLNIKPGALEPNAQKAFFIFLLILAVVTVLAYIMKGKNQGIYTKIWQRVFSFALTNLIIGAFFQFFTYELVPFLSTRILFLFWAVGMIAWVVFIAKDLLAIPKIKEEKLKEKEFKKYIP